jgi:hypothetical protein
VSNQDQQNGESKQPALPATELLDARGAARRKFTRAGVGASGVLMTLASQPGMAAVCATPSGSLSSGMTSRAPNTQVTCGGVSPGYWRNHDWPAGTDRNARFGDIFPCSAASSVMANMKMYDVLICDDPAIDKFNTGSHTVSAYLNYRKDTTYVITPAIMSKIWKEYQDTGGQAIGYYVPAVNHKWYGFDIVNYIVSTFHA